MLKSIVKRAFRWIGLDIRRYVPPLPYHARLTKLLSANHVNLVFDVGANVGQFAQSLRAVGYTGRIVSFEPLNDAWKELQEASRADKLWEIAPRAAIGSEDGEVEIHIAGNSMSSSILRMLDFHVEAAPVSKYTGSEKVPLRRLDSIGLDFLEDDSILFIKIDTQGFEDQVLQGAPELLKAAVGLSVELSLVPLYENQLLYDRLISDVNALGFEIWDLARGWMDHRNGRLLQSDATFFRP